jgi:HAE1 family hydrophobic/amphiphilic exporter-1
VIGGVITSTLLTLVVIPTFYEILDEWREWTLRKFGVYTKRTAEHRIPTHIRPLAVETAKHPA